MLDICLANVINFSKYLNDKVNNELCLSDLAFAVLQYVPPIWLVCFVGCLCSWSYANIVIATTIIISTTGHSWDHQRTWHSTRDSKCQQVFSSLKAEVTLEKMRGNSVCFTSRAETEAKSIKWCTKTVFSGASQGGGAQCFSQNYEMKARSKSKKKKINTSYIILVLNLAVYREKVKFSWSSKLFLHWVLHREKMLVSSKV